MYSEMYATRIHNICAYTLHQGIVAVVNRQLIALILILAIGLQASLLAFAGPSSPMSSECAASVDSASQSQDSCCPSGTHAADCCQYACPAIAGIIGFPPALSAWNGRVDIVLPSLADTFSSRGDLPLIRPPIL